MKNYYDVLDIPPEATTEQVKTAVVQLGKKYAAKAQNNSTARSKFNDIQEAYKVLSHPQRRKYHDEALATQTKVVTDKLELTKVLSEQLAHHKSKLKTLAQSVLQKIQKHRLPILMKPYTKKPQQKSLPQPQKNPVENTLKVSLSPKHIETKKRHYNLFDDEHILFYSKPHILTCLDITALILIALSSYLYLTMPHFLEAYMPIITLWLPHKISHSPLEISLWILALLVILLIGIAIQLEAVCEKLTTEVLLTENRIITTGGFLNRKKTAIKLNTIESISIRQSLLGRLFNYGAVTITGIGHGKVTIRNISAPHKMSHSIWTCIKVG